METTEKAIPSERATVAVADVGASDGELDQPKLSIVVEFSQVAHHTAARGHKWAKY